MATNAPTRHTHRHAELGARMASSASVALDIGAGRGALVI